jgi:hypothetical protein
MRRPTHEERKQFAVGRTLGPKGMDALPAGARVIDYEGDISVKRPDGLWEGYEMAPIPSAKLHKYGPIHLWTGPEDLT